ncbi:MAG TPA: hypothetical protein VK489_11445 [Ferruginibacter sp.]|nr:hypothetical protein [Ferruginibacter sp.]
MKKKKIILSVAVIVIFSTAFKIADDIITKLGIDANRASMAIFSNIINAQPRKEDCSGDCDGFNLQIPKAALLPDIIKGDKAGAAKEVCAYIKQYCESKEFNQAYQIERTANQPTWEKPRKTDQAYIDNLKSSIGDMEKEMKGLSADHKKMYAKILTSLKEQLKEAADPLPQTTKWKEKYPASTDSAIIRGLNFYLSEQATVDFAAPTILKGKTKYFVNTQYEKEKSKTWKTIYRAGKEVNTVVKTFVTDWQKQGVHRF